MVPIFGNGNNKKDLPREDDRFDRSSHGPLPSPPRARASVSHLPPVRKNGSIDFRLNRTSVGDEYGAGPPEVRRVFIVGVLRRGGKRDFSPYLNRGLGESHSEYVREKSLWTLFG